jgi:WD40 repeat protein
VDLDWSPDGGRIAVTTLNGVSLLDAATLEEIAFQATSYGQNALAFSGDGATLATADDWEMGRMFRVWDGHDLALLGEHDLPGSGDTRGAAVGLGFLGDGGIILAVGELPGLGIWTMTTDGSMVRALSVERAEPLTAVLDPSRGWVAVSVGPREAVQVWDIATGEMVDDVPLEGANTLGFTHDGRFLVALLDFVATLWDLEGGQRVGRIPIADGGAAYVPRVAFHISVSHDDRLLASGTEIPSPGIGIWHVSSGQLLGLLTHEGSERVDQFSFSPATDELALLLNDGRLEVWTIEQ